MTDLGNETRTAAAVTALSRAQIHSAASLLTDSLMEDPSYRHLFPDPKQRRVALRAILGAGVRDAVGHGLANGAVLRDALVGVVLAFPPGAFPLTAFRKARSLSAVVSVAQAAPRGLRGLAQLASNIERHYPAEPNWYVEVIGVAPTFQGRGLGSLLLRSVLDAADREGVATYLETAQSRNVGYYERFGFEVLKEVALISGGPQHWTMLRPGPGSRTSGDPHGPDAEGNGTAREIGR